jgi:hypothetical protein
MINHPITDCFEAFFDSSQRFLLKQIEKDKCSDGLTVVQEAVGLGNEPSKPYISLDGLSEAILSVIRVKNHQNSHEFIKLTIQFIVKHVLGISVAEMIFGRHSLPADGQDLTSRPDRTWCGIFDEALSCASIRII